MAQLKAKYSSFDQRLGGKVDLHAVCTDVCRDFGLGSLISTKQIKEGYEDFNVALEADSGKYFVKIFSSFRSNNECKRLVDVLRHSIGAGISTPKLFESEQGHLHIMRAKNVELRLCVMSFIEGNNFLNLDRSPNSTEIKSLARQAAMINSISLKPTYIDDAWSALNFTRVYKERNRYLTPNDDELISPLLNEAKKVDFKKLPHAFVHGDIIAINVIKDSRGKLWIVDFSCSNYYPRIIELAVLTSDLLLDRKEKSISDRNLETALDEYQKIMPLTHIELDALPIVSKLAHAMHVINTLYYKIEHGNRTRENDYYLIKGREGLRQTANNH